MITLQTFPTSMTADANARTARPQATLAAANAARLPLADGSVHMCVTSPPYWGLRKYDGDQTTEWPEVTYAPMPGLPPVTVPAMTSDLGLEPTPEAYVGHLVLIWRELWRVMREDGTVWLNLGSTYSSENAESEMMVLRDDLTDEERAYVLRELAKNGS